MAKAKRRGFDETLCGNHDPCPALAIPSHGDDCRHCGGKGWVRADVSSIVARDAEWGRRHYWPDAEARWAAENEAKRVQSG